jgi:integrase/recombinase XerC
LARYLNTVTDDGFADAAVDPTRVQRAHVEDFQAWMIETRSASTALNKHKALQQFFKWLVSEEEIERSPMERVRQPKTPEAPHPGPADRRDETGPRYVPGHDELRGHSRSGDHPSSGKHGSPAVRSGPAHDS